MRHRPFYLLYILNIGLCFLQFRKSEILLLVLDVYRNDWKKKQQEKRENNTGFDNKPSFLGSLVIEFHIFTQNTKVEIFKYLIKFQDRNRKKMKNFHVITSLRTHSIDLQ